MYTEFYGLREKPFSLSPDPRFLFLSASHREALAHLLYGIEQGEGFIAITGEVGTGKTTLCRTLLQRLEPGSEIAFLFNPQLSGLELLQAITAEFGLPVEGHSRRELMAQLNGFLLTKKQEGRRVLLLIDEAQNLDSEALEQVRLFSNLETDTQKLIQIVLIGQPELDTMLESPHLRQLRQRISVRWRLNSLSASETREYIRHRLRVAAGKPLEVFTEMALREVHRRSAGIPRIVNRLCDRALLAGYSDGSREIGLGAVAQAQRELEGGGDEARSGIAERWRFPLGVAAGGLVVALAAAAGLWWQQKYGASFRSQAEGAGPASEAPAPGPDLREQAQTAPAAARAAALPPAAAATAAPETQGTRTPAERAAFPAAAEAPSFDLGVVLAESSPAATSAAALDALLRRWGKETLDADLLSRSQLRTLLENTGFSVLRLRRASFERLRSIGRPALIVLQAIDGAPRVLLLTSLDRSTAWIEGLDDRPQRVTTEQLARFWFGEALVPWVDHAELPRLLRQGDDGPGVVWLQQSLTSLGYFGEAPTGAFEATTEAGVRAFQAAEALPIDGKVGPLTKIRLYERLPGYAAPPNIAALPASEPAPPRGGTS